ncbi:MAG: site-specific integrase [Treponema sp.]|nr:site-specific integrase [Treponema sp.]
MLFNDLCYEWLEWKKPFVKSKTYETYYGTFVNQIEPFFKKVRCSSVNEDFLDKYSVSVQTSTLNRFNRRPSKNVASKAFQVIKSIISYGQRHHKLRYFEYKFQYVKDESVREIKPLAMSRPDQEKIISYFFEQTKINDPKKLLVILPVMVSLTSGLRIGEVCGLRWEYLDFTQCSIKIICTAGLLYDHENKTEKLLVTSPKTYKSQRTVFIPEILMNHLKMFKTEHKVEGYIFQRFKDFENGKDFENPMRQDMLRRRFNTLMKHLEITGIHFHTLRHTFATQAIEEGINPKTVSELLGHASVSITLDRYVHPSEEEKRKCMNIYSSLVKNK